MNRARWKILSFLGMSLGLGVIVWLVSAASLTAVVQSFLRIGWGALAVVAVRAVMIVTNGAIALARMPDSEDTDAHIADATKYLERHHVTVGQQIASVSREEEGDILLQLAKQHDVGLIVAGAYGRTRLSEWIFGGVTRHLLLSSPVPCLFSN